MITRKIQLIAVTLLTFALAACSDVTAPTSHEDACGGGSVDRGCVGH